MARSFEEQREYFSQQFPAVREGFTALRDAVRGAGPLDMRTMELINTAIYACAHSEGGTKAHAVRAHAAGASPAEVRQAILLGLGLGMGWAHTQLALDWVRDAFEAAGVSG
jgi:alkylhydroperoxidase/carboxymuconolactone decarboxylase family protein YurZ